MQENEDETPLEAVLFLARAESRVRILEHLIAADSATQSELRTQLAASRTTISRSLQSLMNKGWVDKSGDEYQLTRAGALISEAFGELLDTVEDVGELAEFLQRFPPDVDAPDFLAATDVEVTYSTDAAPYAPAQKQTEILHRADRIRMLLPAIDLESTRTITEQVTERGLKVETIVPPEVESIMESAEFAPLMSEKITTGRSSVFVVDTDIPFYLGLADEDQVQIGLADDEGLPRALLQTTDETIREWAEGLYEQYRAESRPKPVEELR